MMDLSFVFQVYIDTIKHFISTLGKLLVDVISLRDGRQNSQPLLQKLIFFKLIKAMRSYEISAVCVTQMN